ncbi:MAG: glycoside hydrolase family 130 protein, partial [Pseudomonadota bacterium]|nr:glycoside hydrolase family 130 protein [Pseudomonadota bacterium]
MVRPSRPDFKVDGTFNAGVVKYGDEIILLVRVAESAVSDSAERIRVPTLERGADGWELKLRSFERSDPDFDFSDPREIKLIRDRRQTWLTSMSHLRLARSKNGTDFTVDASPFLFPDNRYERFGCEDARITMIDGRYYINYTSVSDLGIATSLAVTDDFVSVERLGVILAPDNRDVCLFPRRIGGLYWALHRPAPLHFGSPVIWSATSPDLIHWGDHRIVAECADTGWEGHKIGGGAQMIETDRGWLQIYHGVDEDQRYCLGALLLDIDDPTIVRRRLKSP